MKEYSSTVLSERAIPTIFISKPDPGVKKATTEQILMRNQPLSLNKVTLDRKSKLRVLNFMWLPKGHKTRTHMPKLHHCGINP